MLKILIIDDEEHARKMLARIVLSYPQNFLLSGSCSSVKEALAIIPELRPDVILLDIEMGAENGFGLFQHFPKPEFKTIFVTAYQHYAVEAFRFAALDYLLKPVEPALLLESLERATGTIEREQFLLKLSAFEHNLRHTLKEPKKIVLKTADQVHLVSLPEIVYCESDRNYTSFFLADKTRILVSVNMGYYEELLTPFGFLRIHQSYLLNLAYLKLYEKSDSTAVLKDHTSLPVALRKKELLLQRLSQL